MNDLTINRGRIETVAIGLIAAAYASIVGYIGGDTDPYLLLTMVLVTAAFCLRLSPLVTGQRSTVAVDHVVLALFLALLLLLVYTSTLPKNSLVIGWRLATFALVFAVCFGIARERWLFALGLFLLTGAVSAAWGVIEFFATGTRANGPVVDPSTWGSTQNLYFFALAAVYLGADSSSLRRWQEILIIAGLALFALASCAAYSRVGTAIFFSAIVFVVALAVFRRPLRRRASIIAVVAVVSLLAVSGRATVDEATGHSEGYTLDLESFGWSQRFLMWESALDIYAEFPVFGSGPGTFKLHYPRHRSPDELSNSGNYVHNDYIQFLSEGGPLLLVFLLAFAGWLTWLLLRKTLQVVNGADDDVESLVLVVALGTALAHALVNFPLYQFQVIMMMGLLYARVAGGSSMSREVELTVQSPGLNRFALVLFALIAIVPVALDVVARDLLLDDNELPFTERLEANPDTFFATASRLATYRSRNATNRFALATMFRTTFDQIDPYRNRGALQSLGLATALEYQRGLELNPWNHLARRYFAQFLTQNPWIMDMEGVTSTPETLYREGIAIAPSKVGPYLEYADWLRDAGRDDEAYRLLVDDALPWANHRYDGWEKQRQLLLSRVSREARARQDTETLRRVLERLGG